MLDSETAQGKTTTTRITFRDAARAYALGRRLEDLNPGSRFRGAKIISAALDALETSIAGKRERK